MASATPEKSSVWQAARQYADVVGDHASKGKLSSLHPGENFRRLSAFLNGVSAPQLDVHDYATVHDLSYNIDHDKRTRHFSAAQLSEFASLDMPKPSSGQIIFLRGYPSPEWLRLVGAKYQVDPEVFRQHLAFKVPTEDYFDLPGPSPASHSILKMCVTSIGRQCKTTIDRDRGPTALKAHLDALSKLGSVGNSIVRRFNWHDDKYFSVEQHINACITTCSTGWVCILLLDNGKNLSEGPRGPWFAASQKFEPEEVFLPTLQSHSILNSAPRTAALRRDLQSASVMQSVSLIHNRPFCLNLNIEAMRASPFYALHETYMFAAASESQFLNMVQVNLDIEYTKFSNESYMQQSLANLKYQKEILNDHIQQLQGNIDDISRWRKITSPQEQQLHNIVDQAAADLLEVYSVLQKRAERLSRECGEGMEDVRNSAILAENKKALEQAQGVGHLTFMAFFFLPFSLTTSFFGMNFKELDSGPLGSKLSLWVWFAASATLLVAAILVCFWNAVWKYCCSVHRRLISRFRRVEIMLAAEEATDVKDFDGAGV